MAVATIRRRRLAFELRKLREDRGLSLQDVAATPDSSLSVAKLSRMETGRYAVKPQDVATLLAVYKAEDMREPLMRLARDANKRGWWLPYEDALSPFYADLISLEDEASSLSSYEGSVIHGLLQTADYARRAVEATRLQETSMSIESKVAVRLARQSVLTKPGAPSGAFIVGEAALLARADDDGTVMRGQLQRLLDVAKLPNITVQVLPSDAGLSPALAGGFTIIGFPEISDLDVVHSERLLSTVFAEDPDEVELYRVAFQKITAQALSPEDSSRRIAELRDRIK